MLPAESVNGPRWTRSPPGAAVRLLCQLPKNDEDPRPKAGARVAVLVPFSALSGHTAEATNAEALDGQARDEGVFSGLVPGVGPPLLTAEHPEPLSPPFVPCDLGFFHPSIMPEVGKPGNVSRAGRARVSPAPRFLFMIQGRLVSTAVLARALNVAPRTVNHWQRERGLIPDDVTAGGHARWDIDRVKEWVRSQSPRHQGPAGT